MTKLFAIVLAVMLALVPVSAASADDGGGYSVATQEICGTAEWDGVNFMTKGRTDGIVYRVDHTVGCARVVLSNISPAGHGEAQGNAGQMARAQKYGKRDAARMFLWRFGLVVNPDDITVHTSKYRGED
jgi:hypothetical protein